MTRSNSRELLWVFGECFTRTTLPARIVGMAMRVSCQSGKFHGIIARIGPRGRYETYALTGPGAAGASASIWGPFSAYQSASCAHFSTSASASEKIGLDHMKVYTCGKKFLPTFSNRSMPVKSMAKANHSPKYGECLSL